MQLSYGHEQNRRFQRGLPKCTPFCTPRQPITKDTDYERTDYERTITREETITREAKVYPWPALLSLNWINTNPAVAGRYLVPELHPGAEDVMNELPRRQLTTRNYAAVTKTFRQAYGVEKSAVSERFVQASKEKLREFLERSLADLDLCAMLIDGTPVKGRQMIAVIGIDCEGMKHVLGLREGATENATVVRELPEDLARRGVDFTRVRLYVLDGAKGLALSS